MLRYPCLILDHDDTVVQSESKINYPFFCQILDDFRPGETMTLQEYIEGCYDPGFATMCRQRFQFTDQELKDEYRGWMDFIRIHIPPPYPGIERIIHRQKQEGGMLFVVSHSSVENITRDYDKHFGIQPDEIFGWDYPEHQRKPNPYPLHQIMDKYGFKPEQMLVIDDMKPAWVMCQAAGVPIGFAAWSKEYVPQIKAEMTALCDFTFNSTQELEDFLF